MIWLALGLIVYLAVLAVVLAAVCSGGPLVSRNEEAEGLRERDGQT